MIKNILFDLDGTLVDSAEGILSSVEYAFEHLGDPVPPRKELMCFIGPPLEVSFHDFFGMPMEKARRAVELYRENYTPKGIYQFTLYPGVKEMLAALASAGFTLALATSKPEVFARRILERAGLASCFSAVCGSLLPKGRDDKKEVIAYLMEKEEYDPAETVMVGDRFYDIVGAHACGIPAVGVLYGFGDRAEMEKVGADAVCDTASDVAAFFRSGQTLAPVPETDKADSAAMDSETPGSPVPGRVNIVLVEPEIPQNTGNIARTCAATGAALHLVKPMGFVPTDAKLKRAGLDYWDKLDITYYESLKDFMAQHEGDALYFFSSKGARSYCDVTYPSSVYLVFGKETAGLPEELLEAHYENTLRIPMRDSLRCLNLSNAAAVAVYEVFRQQGFATLCSQGHLTGKK